jgi:outer membrane protein assembly factor BamB
VIWGDRIFIASADEQTREVYAFDRMTGEKLWTCACPFVEPDAEQAELSEETGYAPSTMVTDGRRVYSIFPNADVFAISADSGEVAWSKALGLPENHYGHATSLEMAGRLLFVQLDQGMADEELSALYAFDGASGEEVYRVDRPVDASWTTPVVIRAVQPAQLLLSATPYLISYNPKDGTENWRAEVVEGELAPSQIYAGGLVFTVSPYMEMAAVRIDGSGDVTETNVAWLADNGVPDITSPVASEELYWTATTDGTVTCYEIASGEELWQEETDLELYASPSLVGDQLLLVSSEGLLMTIQAGREYAAVGEFDIGERVMASPAFQDGMMYIRSMQSLMGFEIGGEAAGDGEVRP